MAQPYHPPSAEHVIAVNTLLDQLHNLGIEQGLILQKCDDVYITQCECLWHSHFQRMFNEITNKIEVIKGQILNYVS